jgi:hypothetical protein
MAPSVPNMLQLPGINRRQLADAGRVERPELKILLMTGYAHKASGAK